MKRISLADQRNVIESLQEVLAVLQGVDYTKDFARRSPCQVIGVAQGTIGYLLTNVFGVVPVNRLDVDEGGEPRVVEGTAVAVGRAAKEQCEAGFVHA